MFDSRATELSQPEPLRRIGEGRVAYFVPGPVPEDASFAASLQSFKFTVATATTAAEGIAADVAIFVCRDRQFALPAVAAAHDDAPRLFVVCPDQSLRDALRHRHPRAQWVADFSAVSWELTQWEARELPYVPAR